METICEKDCKSCYMVGCDQRRQLPDPPILTPEMLALHEEDQRKNFDWKEEPEANLSE